MNKPLVSVTILAFNGANSLRRCIDAVLEQTYNNIEILVIDNASVDDSLKILKKYYEGKIKLQENEKNVGFAPGHNQGFAATSGKYILMLNQDLIIEPEYIEHLVSHIERDDRIAGIMGKLASYDFDKPHNEQGPITIDTTGFAIEPSRRINDRGQSEPDAGQYDRVEEIFGCNGGAPLYRRAALEDVKIPIFHNGGLSPNTGLKTEILDEDYFAYVEDVDIAWRLRLRGWKHVYHYKAVGYHDRSASSGGPKKTSADFIKFRRTISPWRRTIGYRNQHLMFLKLDKHTSIGSLMAFWSRELRLFAYTLLFERSTLRAWPDIIKLYGRMRLKRRHIMQRKTVDFVTITKWFKKH